jgi:glycosyltransferase involved in cell wall biosynthesis
MRVLLIIDDLSADESQHDVEFILYQLDKARIQPQVVTLQHAITGIPDALAADGIFSISACNRLITFAREREIELIHAVEPRTWLYAAATARVLNLPAIATVYHFPAVPSYPVRIIRTLLWHILRGSISQVFTPIDSVRRDLWFNVQYPLSQIELIYPALTADQLDLTRVQSRSELQLPLGPLVTILAPQRADQAFIAILEAIPRIRQRMEQVTIAMLGICPDRTWWREIEQNYHHSGIHWLGNRSDAQQVIVSSNAIVAHTQRDSIDAALMLALAMGKPVVSARITGVTDLLESHYTALLVAPGDARDYALQITRLLTQPAFAERIGLAAATFARQHFTPKVRAAGFMTSYEQAVYRHRAGQLYVSAGEMN